MSEHVATSDWVGALADPERRETALGALAALGPTARVAVRAGLGDGRWPVRRCCALWLWQQPDPGDLPALVPLLRDPSSKVRHAVVIVLALAHAARSADVAPLLVERALQDESLRVRRQAVAMLAFELAHPDLEGVFAQLLESERDPKLLRFARAGMRRCRERASC